VVYAREHAVDGDAHDDALVAQPHREGRYVVARRDIAETVSDATDVDDEIRYLVRALGA